MGLDPPPFVSLESLRDDHNPDYKEVEELARRGPDGRGDDGELRVQLKDL